MLQCICYIRFTYFFRQPNRELSESQTLNILRKSDSLLKLSYFNWLGKYDAMCIAPAILFVSLMSSAANRVHKDY